MVVSSYHKGLILWALGVVFTTSSILGVVYLLNGFPAPREPASVTPSPQAVEQTQDASKEAPGALTPEKKDGARSAQ